LFFKSWRGFVGVSQCLVEVRHTFVAYLFNFILAIALYCGEVVYRIVAMYAFAILLTTPVCQQVREIRRYSRKINNEHREKVSQPK